jgi:uncharacterized protein (DUF2336 family)
MPLSEIVHAISRIAARLFQAAPTQMLLHGFVLTSRQMGKSSLMQRTARDLKLEGFRVAVGDLTELGTEGGSDQWHRSFCDAVHAEAGAAWPYSDWWQNGAAVAPARRLTKFLGELAGIPAGRW